MGASSHLSRQGGSVMIRHVGSVFILGSLCPQASCFLLPQLPSARRLAPPILVPEACPWDHTPQQGIGVRRIMNMVSREPEQVRIEDRDVPVAHRGLHGFLYGNEEDHGATANDAPVEIFDGSSLYQGDPHYQLGQPEGGLNIAKAYLKNNKELERGKDVSVSEWLEANVESKHAAVYAVVGKDGTFNFVGVSRNVALTLAGHVKDQGQDKVYQVKVRSFKYPKRDIMGAMQEEWIRECGYIPEGNLPGREWATSLRDVQAAMSTSQREVYEENKLKMRKAMADPDLINEMEQVRTWNLRKDKESLFYFGRQQMSDEEIELRRRLENAMEGDDWSSVIESQTKLTESTPQETQVPSAAISSPFAASGDMAAQGLDEAVPSAPTSPAVPIVLECKDLEFTVENVDKVLDEVRPYLVADGGNVKVMGVDVEARVVKLALQGACGSCPSSTTTMKMGIERVLRENFRDMGEVQQVDEASGSAMGELSVAVVEAILEPLRPAMVAMRAKVEVLSALDGNVRLSFSGHRKVSYGIKMALMDHPLIRQVDFEFVE